MVWELLETKKKLVMCLCEFSGCTDPKEEQSKNILKQLLLFLTIVH